MKILGMMTLAFAAACLAATVDWKLWDTLSGEMIQLAAQGNFRAALPLAIRAVEEARLGQRTGRLASSLDALGSLRYRTGEYREAEKAFLEAIALARPLPDYQPLLARALDNLAAVYSYTGGRAAEVESLRKRALEIAEASLGPDARQVGVHLGNLAISLMDRRKYTEAESLLKRALRLTDETRFPAFAADMYGSLGAAAYHQRQYEAALAHFDRAGRLFRHAGGPESPGLVLQFISVGAIYLKTKQPLEADRALARAEEIAVKVYGPEHPRLAEALFLRAKVLRKLGKRREAAQAAQRAHTLVAARQTEVSPVNARVDVSALAKRR